MSIPILKVRDALGREMEIPAIRGQKGEKGDPGDSVKTYLRLDMHCAAESVCVKGDMAESIGSFEAEILSSQKLLELSGGLALWSVALEDPQNLSGESIFGFEYQSVLGFAFGFTPFAGSTATFIGMNASGTPTGFSDITAIFILPSNSAPENISGRITFVCAGVADYENFPLT